MKLTGLTCPACQIGKFSLRPKVIEQLSGDDIVLVDSEVYICNECEFMLAGENTVSDVCKAIKKFKLNKN
jgi:rubrerythrin